MWSTVGMHEENGKYAILGARMGTWMANCTDWDYIQVRDFEILKEIFNTKINHTSINEDIQDLGYQIKTQLGFDYPFFDAKTSQYMLDLYSESFKLFRTYYR
jgi:hypothetical protein